MEGFRSQPRFFTAARNKPGALELACNTIALGVDVKCLQQTPLFYAARQGNVVVAGLRISLGMRVNFVDKNGNTALDALDYAVVNERFEMVRLLASMGADLSAHRCQKANHFETLIHNGIVQRVQRRVSIVVHKSQAMNAVLKEVREKSESHGEGRKRKRDVESTEACPKWQKRSALISWTYSGTEAEEPEILREDVTVIHENDQFLACVFPENLTTAAKRIRRSALRLQEKYVNVSSFCSWDKSGFCMWFEY